METADGTTSRRPRCPVLVVGAGPAGLAVAATLGRYGVATLLVEERRRASTLPRATVISTRSMELLRAWRLERRVLAGGVDADVWLWECPTLARAAEGRAHAVGYPTREQAAVVSPSAPGTVPQDWLEAVLRRHVGTLPTARFELGTQLVTFDDAPDGVRATLRRRDGRGRAPSVPASSWPPTARTARSGSSLGIEMRERGRARTVGRRWCSAPRCGQLLGGPPVRAVRRHHARGARAVPPGWPG